MPASGHRHRGAVDRLTRQPHVENVGHVTSVLVGAMPRGREVVATAEDPPGQQEPGRQLTSAPGVRMITTKRRSAEPDFEWLLGGDDVASALARIDPFVLAKSDPLSKHDS
jgi:hypothetical protein